MSTVIAREPARPAAHLALTPAAAPPKSLRTPAGDALRGFLANRAAIVGALVVLFFVLVAFLAPWVAPYGADQQSLTDRLKPPSAQHWFGTDDLGRDILSRVMLGAQISLRVGILAVLIALVTGTLIGLQAGFLGGWVDGIFMRGMDIVLAFPSTLLAIGIVAMHGPSLDMALVAIGVVNIPVYARLARSMALSVKEREYVQAARCLGASGPRIVASHILPNSMTALIVQATLGIATAIIEAAALGFLGLGAQPPAPEWGLMLTNSRAFLINAPWAMIFPGLAIMLSTLAFNLVGDGVRDALDPRES
jgi:peptide/nickel transport system permease protein